MNDKTLSFENERLSLKEPMGWFAAGDCFRKASTLLSDGAFKLFVYLCLEASRRTGRVETTHKQLASALGKSKRSIGNHVDELQAHEVCNIFPAKNQYARTVFEISDHYWPYHRSELSQQPSDQRVYVDSVREYFLSLGCASGRFSADDEQTARQMYERGIPLAVIENAILLGACRKYLSWLNRQALEPIQGLRYFEPVIAEIQAQSLPPGYAAYLRSKIQELTLDGADHGKGSLRHAERTIRGPYGSTAPSNAAYKRSWSEKLSLKEAKGSKYPSAGAKK